MRARTLIYLDPDDLHALRAEAKSRGISLAELMRRVVREHVNGGKRARSADRKAYLKLVALGSSKRKDISEHHDAYLAAALRREHSR
jgi:hypothetical protein